MFNFTRLAVCPGFVWGAAWKSFSAWRTPSVPTSRDCTGFPRWRTPTLCPNCSRLLSSSSVCSEEGSHQHPTRIGPEGLFPAFFLVMTKWACLIQCQIFRMQFQVLISRGLNQCAQLCGSQEVECLSPVKVLFLCSQPFPLGPGGHRSAFCHHSFAFSGMTDKRSMYVAYTELHGLRIHLCGVLCQQLLPSHCQAVFHPVGVECLSVHPTADGPVGRLYRWLLRIFG